MDNRTERDLAYIVIGFLIAVIIFAIGMAIYTYPN